MVWRNHLVIVLSGLLIITAGSCPCTGSRQRDGRPSSTGQNLTKPPPAEGAEENEFARLREAMVKTQLVHPSDERPVITDELVLKAVRKVRRHEFIPKERWGYAYEDMPVSIGQGQTISQPYMVALMTQCLQLKGTERVLEIGTGLGYQAAVLAEITPEVYTIEILKPLYEVATRTLKDLGYQNIKTRLGDGFFGWPEAAPFDRIIITCAVTRIPQPLLDQLKEGGSIVLPMGETFQESVLTIVRKEKGQTIFTEVIPCRFVPMTGKIQE